ncbi:MAG: helix-turn-helix domain-containing protein [Pseudomonadota bacterium]
MPKKNTSPADWHPADVVAELRKRGTSLRQLALAHGYAPRSLNKALRSPWMRGERIIAAALRLRPRDIWPSRFDAHGRRLDRRRTPR